MLVLPEGGGGPEQPIGCPGKTFSLQHQLFEELSADEREEASRDDMSNRELFETDSWIEKKLCEVRWLAVHFAQGTAATIGTNVRTLPCSVPCPAESHETVDKPICITPAEKDKRARSDIRREKSRVDKVGYRLSPAYREKAKSRREKPS